MLTFQAFFHEIYHDDKIVWFPSKIDMFFDDDDSISRPTMPISFENIKQGENCMSWTWVTCQKKYYYVE